MVQRPLDAYRWEDPAGFNTLPDRLMRAIEAGSIAGGDVRCNQGSVRQTTSMAAILVARGSDPPYATENIGMTDAGTDKAPWLNLSVRASVAGTTRCWNSAASTTSGGGHSRSDRAIW